MKAGEKGAEDKYLNLREGIQSRLEAGWKDGGGFGSDIKNARLANCRIATSRGYSEVNSGGKYPFADLSKNQTLASLMQAKVWSLKPVDREMVAMTKAIDLVIDVSGLGLEYCCCRYRYCGQRHQL